MVRHPKVRKIGSGMMLISASFLLCLNLYGSLHTLRNPTLYEERNTLFQSDITLTPGELSDCCRRLADEPDSLYVKRVCKTVNKGIAHYWIRTESDPYHLDVPFWENYLLASYLSLWPPEVGYEFIDPAKALERGIGLCSQHVMAAVGILTANDIAAKPILLSGHMVAEVRGDDGSWYVIDPDFDVVMPTDLQSIQGNVAAVIPYYESARLNPDSAKPAAKAARLADVFGSEGNVIYESVADCWGEEAVLLEQVCYFLKWSIPAGIYVVLAIAAIRSKGRNSIHRRRPSPPMPCRSSDSDIQRSLSVRPRTPIKIVTVERQGVEHVSPLAYTQLNHEAEREVQWGRSRFAGD
ncbi:MAG: hypothetical protein ABII79_05955 [bacterium]